MKKKIVAAICAAALALAMPAAAFAVQTLPGKVVSDSMSSWSLEKPVEGDNADMTAFSMVANSKWVAGAVITKTDAKAGNYQAYTNDLLVQSFKIDAKDLVEEWDGECDSVNYTIKFSDKKIAQFPTTVDKNNLYARAYIDHEPGYETVAPTQSTKVVVNTDRCSTVTAVLANGPLSYGQPVGANNVDDLNKAAADGSKSPKTGELA